MTRKIILLLIVVLALGTSACSIIFKESNLRPELSNTSWTSTEVTYRGYLKLFTSKGYRCRFQHGSVSVTLNGFHLRGGDDGTLIFGPPLIPLIPVFLWSKPRPYRFGFYIALECPTETCSMELSKIRILSSEGKVWQIDKFRTSRERNPDKITASNGKDEYSLTSSEELPLDIEEILLDLGSIQINGDEVKLPHIRILKKTKYGYYPVYAH